MTNRGCAAVGCMWRASALAALERDLVTLDMPHDGSCVVWAVRAPLARALARPTLSLADTRSLLVDALASPAMRADVEQDYRVTCAEGAPMRDVDALLEHWRNPSAYLPPLLVAMALERVHRLTTLVLTLFHATDDELVVLHATNAAARGADVMLLHDEASKHTAALVRRPNANADASGVGVEERRRLTAALERLAEQR